eukprot:963784-Pleurochrysis_carterae.AAC.2
MRHWHESSKIRFLAWSRAKQTTTAGDATRRERRLTESAHSCYAEARSESSEYLTPSHYALDSGKRPRLVFVCVCCCAAHCWLLLAVPAVRQVSRELARCVAARVLCEVDIHVVRPGEQRYALLSHLPSDPFQRCHFGKRRR